MTIIETGIEGLIIIEPKVYEDSRGYFFESYNADIWKNHGMNQTFVQDNESKSAYGVVRGLHYQLAPHSQTKMVRVLQGEVMDVAVDLRKNSRTFGKHYSTLLSDQNKRQMLIPKGFAHGFAVLSEVAVFFYKCDAVYHPESERGIRFNDSQLGIDWLIPEHKQLVSAKDQGMPLFSDAEMNF